MQPLKVQLLTMSHILEKLIKLTEDDFEKNLLVINRLLLEIEIYLDQLQTVKLNRKMRLTINKFQKGHIFLKVNLFLKSDQPLFKKEAIYWSKILRDQSKLV